MKMVGWSMIPLALAMTAPAEAGGQRHSREDQEAAREARKQGKLLPLREIERRIVPQLPGAQYIGFDFDSDTAVYTLKFLREGNVIWVSVDGRSGAVISRTGR